MVVIAIAALVWWYSGHDAPPPAIAPIDASDETPIERRDPAPRETRPVDRIRSQPIAVSDEPASTIESMGTESPDTEEANLIPVRFLIVDRAGAPIADARVCVATSTSSATGMDGRTTMRVPPGTDAFLTGAPYFRIESFPFPRHLPPRPEELRVVLTRASVLVARVRHEEASEFLKGLRLCVEYSPDKSILGAANGCDFGQVRVGRPTASQFSARVGASNKAWTHTLHFDVSPGGDITVSGFRDGDELTARVEDRHGTRLIEQQFNMVAEETTAVELVVVSKPRDLRGTVIDDRGMPVEGVPVRVAGAKSLAPPVTDASGAFELRDIYETDPSIWIAAPQFVPTTVPWLGETMTIQLERGRNIQVKLTGGNPDGWSGRANLEFTAHQAHMAGGDGDKGFHFLSVPRRAGKITVYGPKTSKTVPIGPDETEIEVVRPE